jgi:signal transduction histidine kinase
MCAMLHRWLLFFAVLAGAAASLEITFSQTLTNAGQIRGLTQSEAARGLPVRLRGTFIGHTQVGGYGFVVFDGSEGIYVYSSPSVIARLHPGDQIEIEGQTDPGGFAPFVRSRSVRRLGQGELPKPRRVALGELHSPALDAQWVEVVGIVRHCSPIREIDLPNTSPATAGGNSTSAADGNQIFKLKLASGAERVTAQINAAVRPEELVDAEVRMQAMCFSRHNPHRQLLSPLLVMHPGAVPVVERPSAFASLEGEPRSVASLMQFERNAAFGHRVHVRGLVTHHRRGVSLWLRDGEHGLQVQSESNEILQPGDEVDVLGFPALGENSPILEDAVFKRRGRGARIEPVRINELATAVRHDADLVELEARLVASRPVEGGWAITLAWNTEPVEALLRPWTTGAKPENWLPGSGVRVVGICAVTPEKSGPMSGVLEPRSFQIFLRSPSDLTVIRFPPWWTPQRTIAFLGIIVGALVMITAIVMLAARRRLREQAMRRATAEVEFAAILNERNRVAREIHDTLAQGLAATSVHLRLARRQAPPGGEELTHQLDVAQQLVQSSLEEARNTIWNMRSHVLETGDLPQAIKGILDHMAEGSEVSASCEVTGRVRRLAPVIENNLLRVGQEAITNAIKHSQATRILVTLDFAEKQFRLTVSDDGKGFDPAQPRTRSSGFGLLGIRERAKELNAELNIRSSAGAGTEINIIVPLPGE